MQVCGILTSCLPPLKEIGTIRISFRLFFASSLLFRERASSQKSLDRASTDGQTRGDLFDREPLLPQGDDLFIVLMSLLSMSQTGLFCSPRWDGTDVLRRRKLSLRLIE